MWPIGASWAAILRSAAGLDTLVVAMPGLVVQLARILGAEAAANGLLRGLDVVTGLGFADCVWLALVPADVLVRALGVAIQPVRRLYWGTPRDVLALISGNEFGPVGPSRQETSTRKRQMKGTAMIALLHRPAHRSAARPRRQVLALQVLTAALVAVGLTTTPLTAAVATTDPTGTMTRGGTVSLKGEIRAADDSLARARAQIRAHRYYKAVRSLDRVARHTRRANAAAQALIGAPPADPESDDPPGPPAVLAATRLDYRISTGAIALFDEQRRTGLVRRLRGVVGTAQVRRDQVLDVVIGLPQEGDGADYADGLADTLGLYDREVKAISAALNAFTLSDSGRTGVHNALARAEATRAKMIRAFGGGERPAH